MGKLEFPESGTLLTEERMVVLLGNHLEEIKKVIAAIPAPKPDPDKEPDKEPDTKPDPKPQLPDCPKPLTIGKVTKSSDSKRLTVLFDTRDVYKMAAKVSLEASGNEVQITDIVSSKNGKSLLLDEKDPTRFAPDNNSPVLVLNSKVLGSPNKYVIELKALECKGEASYVFFLTK